ncbi:MEDS domain-containing protein, partial [Pseudonocardia sp. ICBG601]|uniref:MEDS domain-containing protein n=1 Tax=Pseudonocardia sp. ICBG601 TaxID=2846759 RepID=UPI001CF6A328
MCAVPDSTEHLGELAAAYVGHGLDRGERILYFDDDGAADVLLRRLAEDGVEVDDPLRRGPAGDPARRADPADLPHPAR